MKIVSFDKIVSINNQLITAKYVKTLDYNEREALVEPLFQHFRQQGWVYPDNPSKLNSNWKKLCDWKPNLLNNELFNNSSMATDICKYFCHKFYESTEFGKPTMKEIFDNDEKLKYLIRNRLGFDWWDKEDNDETFNISFRMMIQGLRSSRLVPSISMFKPNIAKYMYMKYSQENDIVYDYSAGWGGRMLGAASCNRSYIGVDPWTTDELQNMVNYFNLSNIQLINSGSEHIKLDENSIDFSFSSPPYFDQEYYSSDKKQAYNNGEDYFYNVYWAQTLQNIKCMLKPNKWFGLNVKNYPKMLQMAKDIFGNVIETINLRTVRSHLNKSAGTNKVEYIYMFKNEKYNHLDNQIINLYKSGQYMKSIGRKLSIDSSVVKRVLSKHNIPAHKLFRKHLINEIFFDSIDSESKSYMLGFLFADGAISKYNICLTLSEKDKDILLEFSKFIFNDNVGHVTTFTSKQMPYNNYSKININSKYMVSKLIKLGCTSAKSLTLKFPTLEDEKCLRHFIRGYFDGDGSVNEKNRTFVITSTLEFCQKAKEILEKYTLAKLHIYKYKNIYRLTSHGRNQILKIFKWLYRDANYFLLRKYNIFANVQNEKSKYFSDEMIRSFVYLSDNGKKHFEIAKQFNCSVRGVDKAIIRFKNNS